MTDVSDVPLDELVPHRPPMRFLDRVLSADGESVVAETVVRPENPLFQPGRGLPSYTGLEMMAQAIAAIDGMKRREEGLPPKIGFLMGCRRYSVFCREFPENARLNIYAKMTFSDETVYTFDCHIADAGGAELVRAHLSVYAPPNPSLFLSANAR